MCGFCRGVFRNFSARELVSGDVVVVLIEMEKVWVRRRERA